MELDPKAYNLPARTQLAEISGNQLAIVVERKSRIIMADGKKLLEKVAKIKEVAPGAQVTIVTTAPVCSKTRRFLQENNVLLQETEDVSHLSK